MSTQVQYRRGTGAQNDAFVGALAEITVDTTNKTLRVHDGATAGGSNIATVTYVDNAISSLSADSISNGTSQVKVISSGGNILANVGGSTIGTFYSGGLSVSGTVSATSLTGTLTTAAQTNITSVGTLSSLAVTGNVSTGNVSGTNGTFTNVAGTLTTASQTNITAVGTLTTGTWSASTIATNKGGTGLTSFTSGGALYATSTSALTTGTLPVTSGGTGTTTSTGSGSVVLSTSPTLTTPNLGTPSAATLTNATGLPIVAGTTGTLSVARGGTGVTSSTGSGSVVLSTSPSLTTPSIGAATGSSLNLSTGTLTAGAITNGNANGVGNIGSSVGYFNTVFAKATSAQYADVAERYVADKNYEPGTVLEIGGVLEVTETTSMGSTKIAGVVSTAPAMIMNSAENSETAVTVALLGRVPCKVVGPVARGDLLCSSDEPGHAQALPADRYQPGCVIGKALEDHTDNGAGVIEIMVGRL